MIAERTALAAEGIVVPTVDLPTYERVSDKQSFVSLARKYGLATPMECDGIPSRFVRKFVVKPVQGIWGRSGILTSPVLVESEEGLRLLLRRSLSPEYHFVQEWVEGPSYYYCGLYVDGKKSLSFHQKTLTQQPAGRSVVRAIPALLPEIVVARIDAMMESLQWQGLMMIEVKESGGLYYAIECNPRLWGPMQLAVDNGIDFPYALWRMARGEAPETSPMPRRPVGYVWLTGYVRGWLLARKTGTRFQRNSEGATQGLRFRDVWLRLDTLPYSVVELLRAVWAYVRGALERRSELGTLDEDGGLV
jgi:predicted ATP-grasp superfamily ATP-dependent carboligase